MYRCSQKAAFVSPLISWLPKLQPQRTPIEHCRESCTANLAVHYYPLFLIEGRNIWPNNLREWKYEILSSSKMSLNKNSEHFSYNFRASFKKKSLFSKSAKVIVCDPDDKQRCPGNFLYRVQWGSAKAEMYNHSDIK